LTKQHHTYDHQRNIESIPPNNDPIDPKAGWNPYEHYKEIEVAESYDQERFNSISGKAFDHFEKQSISRAFSGLPRNATILDAPCGTGRLAERLLEDGYRVLGMDISPAMLDVASRKLQRFGDRFQTRVADVRELSSQDLRFDAALCARILMHFPLQDQIDFLSNISKVSSGIVVFNHSVKTPYQNLRRRIKKLLRNQNPVSFPVTNNELKTLIIESGLTREKSFSVLPIISEAIVIRCVHSTQ
jgi:ubiquinone/menaquinone biosynthesis C-methylase UbiE